ncbi:MAG TPA: hypothetical protein VIL57_10305 [Bacteroidia bacterium]
MILILFRMSLLTIAFSFFQSYSKAQRVSANPYALSLGSCSYALDDLSSIGNNPAAYPNLKGIVLQSHYRNKFFSSALNDYAAHALYNAPKYGSLGLHFQRSGFRLFNRNELSASYSRFFGPAFSIGMNFNYHFIQQASHYPTLHTFSADLGLQVRFLERFVWGFVIYNPIPMRLSSLWPEKIPTIIGTGFQYRNPNGIRICMEIDKWIQGKWGFKLGASYQLLKAYSVSLGFKTNPLAPSLGFGFTHKQWHLHWGAAYNNPLGLEMALSLAYQWKRE